jgi:chaperonin GroEL (HSP60 family)
MQKECDLQIVYGGGASEIVASLQFAKPVDIVGESEQYSLHDFGDALEGIPAAYAYNSRMYASSEVGMVKAV